MMEFSNSVLMSTYTKMPGGTICERCGKQFLWEHCYYSTTGAKVWSESISRLRMHYRSNPAKQPFFRELSRLRHTHAPVDENILQIAVFAVIKEYFDIKNSATMADWKPELAETRKLHEFSKHGLNYSSEAEKRERGQKYNDTHKQELVDHFLDYMEDGAWEDRHTMETLFVKVIKGGNAWLQRRNELGSLRDYFENKDSGSKENNNDMTHNSDPMPPQGSGKGYLSGKSLDRVQKIMQGFNLPSISQRSGDAVLKIACKAQGIFIGAAGEGGDQFLKTEFFSTIMNKCIARGKVGARAAAYIMYCASRTGKLTWDQYELLCWFYTRNQSVSAQGLVLHENVIKTRYFSEEDETVMLFRGTRMAPEFLQSIKKSGVLVCNRITSFTISLTVWQSFMDVHPSMVSSGGNTAKVLLCVKYPISVKHKLHKLVSENFIRFLATSEHEYVCMPSTSFRIRIMYYNKKPYPKLLDDKGRLDAKEYERRERENQKWNVALKRILSNELGIINRSNRGYKIDPRDEDNRDIVFVFMTPIPLNAAMQICGSKGLPLTIMG